MFPSDKIFELAWDILKTTFIVWGVLTMLGFFLGWFVGWMIHG